MRYAAIDIGSNSVKLLIAEVAQRVITRQIIFRHTVTGLSKTMKNHQLNPENMALTLSAIIDYIGCCKEYNVQNIRITATQFARVATNAAELLDNIRSQTGFTVEIISGDEEARLTYLAVAQEFADERIMVFNIGGGSTEFIIATPHKTELRTSLPIGAGQLSRDFLTSVDIINNREYLQMQDYILGILHEKVLPFYSDTLSAAQQLPIAIPPKIILSGGTGTNIAQIAAGATLNWENTACREISTDEVNQIAHLLCHLNLTARQAIPGIEANRADVLPAGIAIVTCLLQLCRADKVYITNKSLAHGIICGMLE
ncbi:MAG: hypothetical protein WCV63_09130 [Negativicutes bacterium]|jgi:exopolyphosphatase/guanosine-5'-triphosphate,3'-diphosphate pyrophosphatase